MNQKIIQRGAEAEIILSGNQIIKKRVKKSYRIPELDEKIRKLRTRSEAKLLERASKIIPVPKIIRHNEKTKEIILEFIDGKKLSEHLDEFPLKKQKEICEKIGEQIGKLHENDIVHGDLTTSNMIYVDDLKSNLPLNSSLDGWVGGNRKVVGGKNFQIYFIDFGLGFISPKVEDKAVDLHLLKEAIEAKHFKNWEILFDSVISRYKKSKDSKWILEQFKKVEMRGRYKEKY
jgi:tRNA A-37 threonylcarbamoyl transferase component Bud32